MICFLSLYIKLVFSQVACKWNHTVCPLLSAVIQSGCIILYFHQQYMKILVVLQPHCNIALGIINPFNFSDSNEGIVLVHLGRTFISQMTIDIENIFMFLLVIHVYSLWSVCSNLLLTFNCVVFLLFYFEFLCILVEVLCRYFLPVITCLFILLLFFKDKSF